MAEVEVIDMSFIAYLRKERYKVASNAVVATIGFTLALLANSAVEGYKDRRAFRNTLSAIRVEARSNASTLEDSFLPMFDGGIVFREFAVATTAQALATPSFTKLASKEELECLAKYVRVLTLSNVYRRKSEEIRFNSDFDHEEKGRILRDWDQRIVDAWGNNLDSAKEIIQRTSQL